MDRARLSELQRFQVGRDGPAVINDESGHVGVAEALEIRVFRTLASESIDPEKAGPMILIGWDMQGT